MYAVTSKIIIRKKRNIMVHTTTTKEAKNLGEANTFLQQTQFNSNISVTATLGTPNNNKKQCMYVHNKS